MAFDFKKVYKEFYRPKNKPEIVTVPKANYIAVIGKGNPNEEGGAYQQAMEEDLPYEIKCPALLICGKKDHAGSCIRYNRAWHKNTGLRIEWIDGAGHNSNTDEPEYVNSLIENLVETI